MFHLFETVGVLRGVEERIVAEFPHFSHTSMARRTIGRHQTSAIVTAARHSAVAWQRDRMASCGQTTVQTMLLP